MGMTNRPVKKAVNRVKSSLERRAGPVRKDQDAAPIADAMRDFWARGMLSFSIPAHAGGLGPAPEFTQWAGMETARFDLPMSHGVDTRDRAWGVQSTAQELFAEAVGAKQTLFSTNGSSLNVHVAIMTVAGPGETLVMARNGHKSSFAGLVMSGARPVYLDVGYDEDLEIALGPRVEDLARVLEEHPEAKAALVLTPSYYGTSADVAALADACHARDLPLVTDDAWGLDYALSGHPDLPGGALAQGADLTIGTQVIVGSDPDVGAVGRLRQDRHRAAPAVLRAGGVDERIGAAAVEHRRRPPSVRARRRAPARSRREERAATA